MSTRVVGPVVGLWLLATAGCVVDVDLGRSPDVAGEPGDPPIDAATDSARALDRGPADLAAADAEPADASPIDPGPPDGDMPAEVCSDCIDALAAGVDCADGLPCLIDEGLLAACGDLCGAPDDGTCDGCYATIQPLVDACRQLVADATCEELEVALLVRCEVRCFDAACGECLDGRAAGCGQADLLDCAGLVVSDFEACLGTCDGPQIFDAIICANDAGEAWSLCTMGGGVACDAHLDEELGQCRALAVGDALACVEACDGLAGIRGEACLDLGGDGDLCAARAAAADEVCLADCQSNPVGACGPVGRARTAVCEAGGGPECAPLGEAISDACVVELLGEVPCGDCLALVTANYDACRGAGCVDDFEIDQMACLDACGGISPTFECRPCARDADARLGRCLLDGEGLMACLAQRDRDAAGCLADCGDAIARAVPCRVRLDDLNTACDFGPADQLCYDEAYAFAMACSWARLGVD